MGAGREEKPKRREFDWKNDKVPKFPDNVGAKDMQNFSEECALQRRRGVDTIDLVNGG